MAQEIRYGAGATLRLDLPPEVLLADCTRGRARPLDDPAAAVAAALSNPFDFPPLSTAIVPGDRIAVAIDRGTPRAEAVVSGVVRSLLEIETPPSDITIVMPGGSKQLDERDFADSLPDHVWRAVNAVVHNPRDPAHLCYLAASKHGRPIYMNRVLCDADVVLPVCVARLETSLGYAGVHGGLFPTFSDEETQQRFQSPASVDWPAHQQRRREEADEAAWLLGVQFTVQVVPGPGESILHALAGDVNSVAARSRELCESAWLYEAPGRASLVVAAIEGGQQQQTWENFARALFAASRVVSDHGAIVLCTDLRCAPGPALKRLAAASGDGLAAREIRRDRSPDAVSASLLAEALRRTQVYLLSGLDESVVEDLGLGHVAKAEEINRLGRQHDTCILLANAQHACFTPLDR